jgi:tetratricopeptide (TPR) repeat protein
MHASNRKQNENATKRFAYARLGTIYQGLGQSQIAEQNREKAFDLRDHTSEREKLYIMSHYYADSGQLDKGIETYEVYKQTYPHDSIPYNNLADINNVLGQFEDALENARHTVELSPDSLTGYTQIAIAYAGLNRLEEAKSAVNEALKQAPNNLSMHALLSGIAWNQDDLATMENELKVVANGGAIGEFMALADRAVLARNYGKAREARELTKRVEDNARRMGLKEAAASLESQKSIWEAAVGFQSEARASVNRALRESRSPIVALYAATTLAMLGHEARAMKLVSDVAMQRPFDTMVQYVHVPLVKAAVELKKNQPAKAIDLLDGAMAYGRTDTRVLYARGLAYLRDNKPAEAALAFQRTLDQKLLSPEPMLGIARLGLARACAQQGDRERARIEYQNFLARWKDADPDIPLLKEAKAEYSRLQSLD